MVTSAGLLVLACLLAPVSIIAVWADTQVLNTDRYVQTMAPLADDPAVQAAVAAKVTSTVLESMSTDASGQAQLSSQRDTPQELLAELRALAQPMSKGVEDLVRTLVTTIVARDEFASVWVVVNRVAHEQVVRRLADDAPGAVTSHDDAITLDLAPIIGLVKQELVKGGFPLADMIPNVERSFVLVQSDDVPEAQRAYRALDTLGPWLPLVVLGLFSVGVLAATDRRRTVLRGALGIVVGMLLVVIGLPILRANFLESTPADMLSPAAAGHIFDALLLSLRTWALAVAAFGLFVAVICYFRRPSPAARRTRSSSSTTA